MAAGVIPFIRQQGVAQRVHARELEAVAAEVVRAVAHQIQQGRHPGAQRVGRHPHKTRCTHTPQVSKRRQLRLPGGGIGRVLRRLGDQVDGLVEGAVEIEDDRVLNSAEA